MLIAPVKSPDKRMFFAQALFRMVYIAVLVVVSLVFMFSKSPLLSERLPQWRQRVVLVALLGAFLALIGRSLYLQAFTNAFLADKGRAHLVQMAIPER